MQEVTNEMADQTITPVAPATNAFEEIAAADYAALTAANEGVFTPPKDGRYALHFKVTAAGGATITVEHGDGITSGQGDIVSAALAQNDERLLVLESARVKKLTGDDKGKIRVTVTDAVSVACIQLP